MVHAMRPVSSPIVTFWLGMPRPAMAASRSSTDARPFRRGDVGGEQRRRRARPSAARTRGRARPSRRSGPQIVQRTGDRPASPPLTAIVSWKTSKGFGPSGVRYLPGSRGSGSMRTRSLQSPPVLVKPQATWPLLPTTMLGRPGKVRPVIFCGAPSASVKRHRRAIPDDRARRSTGACRWQQARRPMRCASPATAQLLLPMISAASRSCDGHRDTEAQRRQCSSSVFLAFEDDCSVSL